MGNEQNLPLTYAENYRRRQLMNTVGGAEGLGDERARQDPAAVRRTMAHRERLIAEGQTRAYRLAEERGEPLPVFNAPDPGDPSATVGGIAGFDFPDPESIVFEPVDLSAVRAESEALTFEALQNATTRGLPLAIEFAQVANKASEETFEAVLDFVLPGEARNIRSSLASLTSNLLRGNLPSDVSRRIMLQAAARSQVTGQPAYSPFIRNIATADLATGYLGGVNQAMQQAAFASQYFTPPYVDPGRLGLAMFEANSVPVATALQNAQFNATGMFNENLSRFSATANNALIAQNIIQARLDREMQMRNARTSGGLDLLPLIGMVAGAVLGGVGSAIGGAAGAAGSAASAAGTAAGTAGTLAPVASGVGTGLTFSASGALTGASLGMAAGNALYAATADTPAQVSSAVGAAGAGLNTGLGLMIQQQAQAQQAQQFNAMIAAMGGGNRQPVAMTSGTPGTASALSPLQVQAAMANFGQNQTAVLPPINSFNSGTGVTP